MGLVDEVIQTARDVVDRQPPTIAWGDVVGVAPTLVRFRGDTADTAVPLRLAGYTPTTNDRVMLVRVGSAWVIVGEVVNA